MLSNMQGYDSEEARNRIKSCVSGLEINFTRLASSPHVVCKDDESLALFLALAVTKTKMYGGIFQGSAQEFWREYKIGGRGGWATYTVEVLLLILICQLAAKLGCAWDPSSQQLPNSDPPPSYPLPIIT